MTLELLLIALRTIRVRLITAGTTLRVEAPRGMVTEELAVALCEHKSQLLALPLPHLNDRGEVVIPMGAPPQYHWQPLGQTLLELQAPPEVWSRYIDAPYPSRTDLAPQGTATLEEDR